MLRRRSQTDLCTRELHGFFPQSLHEHSHIGRRADEHVCPAVNSPGAFHSGRVAARGAEHVQSTPKQCFLVRYLYPVFLDRLRVGCCLKVCKGKCSRLVIADDALSIAYLRPVGVGAGIRPHRSPSLAAVSWELLVCWEERSEAGLCAGACKGSDGRSRAGPHRLLVDQLEDSERREIEAEQGGSYASTAFPSVSMVHC